MAGLLAFLLSAAVTTSAAASSARLVRPAQPEADQPPTDRPPLLTPAFHQGRRAALRQRLPTGGVAVLLAGPVRNMAADVDYAYHPDPDFYYLTGLREAGSALVLFKDPQPDPLGGPPITELLFVLPRDSAGQEIWNGARLGPARAAHALGFGRVLPSSEFGRRCPDLTRFAHLCFLPPLDEGRDSPEDSTEMADLWRVVRRKSQLPADFDPASERLYTQLRRPHRQPEQFVEWVRMMMTATSSLKGNRYLQAYLQAKDEKGRATAVAALPPPGRFDISTLEEALNDLRELKQPEELALLRYAINTTVTGHREALRTLAPTQAESDLDGTHLHVYRHYGATAVGYSPIVGAGANGCVLHYDANEKERIGSEMVVMDVGAAYGGYTADVTRTAPGSGRFSPEQRAIYELVLQAQEAGIKACKAGTPFFEPGEVATRVVAQGLMKLGLITHPDSVRRYFPHGTSHYLGLDVHDRGTYGPLRPSSVITVEPGIYIPPGSPCDRKWWGIGCRIEDDVLITEKGCENLSAGVPREPAALEKLIAEPSVLEGWLK